MGILGFARRHQAVRWEPEDDNGVLVTSPVPDMDDPSAVGDRAYGVRFWCLDQPLSVLTIWAYGQASDRNEAGYAVAFRIDREHAMCCRPREEQWSDRVYHTDLDRAAWLDPDSTPDSDALAAAGLLSHGDRGAVMDYYADPGVIAGWFAWDGVPERDGAR